MRLAGQAQLGYYPTPDRVLDLLRTWLHVPSDVVALDPSCGTGAALAALAPDGFTYGVELDQHRAHAAQQQLTAVLPAAFEETWIAPSSFGLVLLNPPYDQDAATGQRAEAVFLARTLPLLAPGGVVVLIVPDSQIQPLWAVLHAHHLWVDQIWRVPDPEYARIHQAVLVGHRVPPRALQTRSQCPWDWADRTTRSYRLTYPALAVRPPFTPVITVPTGRVPLGFTLDPLRPDALAAYLTANAGAFGPLRARTTRAAAPSADHPVRPPLPLHRGHLATLLAAGVLSGALGTGDARHLVRGRVVPVETTEVATTDGEIVRTTRRSFAITVTTLHPDGTLTTWGQPAPLVTDDEEPPPDAAEEASA